MLAFVGAATPLRPTRPQDRVCRERRVVVSMRVRNSPSHRRRKGNSGNESSLYADLQQSIREGETNRARSICRDLTSRKPWETRAWLAWAKLEASLGNIHDSRSVFQRGLKWNPECGHLYHSWGVTEEKVGELDRARELFAKCLEVDHTDGVAWQSYALLENRCQNYSKARDIVLEGLKHDHRSESLWNTYGVVEQNLGNLRDAARCFRKATECNPDHIQSWQAWAVVEEKIGNWETAEYLFNRALEVDPASAATYQAYAIGLEKAGHIDRARATFYKGCEADPRHPYVYHAWARMEDRVGNHEIARSLFAVGFNAAPSSIAMLRSWSEMEQRLGHITETSDWRVPRKAQEPSVVQGLGERLLMLGRLIEGKSAEDTRLVMEWLARRAREDKDFYRRILIRGGAVNRNKLKEWVEGRTEKDISAFQDWFEKRYEEDRLIGSYIFGWNIPRRKRRRRVKRKMRMPPVPHEWYMLEEIPLSYFDDEYVDLNSTAIEPIALIRWLEELVSTMASRAALTTAVAGLSTLLLFVSNVFGLLEVHGTTIVLLDPPSQGVDAHLIQSNHEEPVLWEIAADENVWQ